ncbi:hypothetical protein HanXRQr2_Chr16g0777071 [Helianthus annuus]|uniref:Uncharacterized protein n=1 Tax=Helianthus annuus TaxID=4232 RepID=A0A9K3DWZ4_HELAN|nr:hypothetical protein HanXRQr2_Chr16g0777071 [Helianthus annuus]KAJ0823586.1 hypothetical protein HanPSC8_Chr16g0745451 [Helianthus annuus]
MEMLSPVGTYSNSFRIKLNTYTLQISNGGILSSWNICIDPNPPNSISINPKSHRPQHIPLKTPLSVNATSSSSSSTSYNKPHDTSDEAMTIEALRRFIRLNLRNWTGSLRNPSHCRRSIFV